MSRPHTALDDKRIAFLNEPDPAYAEELSRSKMHQWMCFAPDFA